MVATRTQRLQEKKKERKFQKGVDSLDRSTLSVVIEFGGFPELRALTLALGKTGQNEIAGATVGDAVALATRGSIVVRKEHDVIRSQASRPRPPRLFVTSTETFASRVELLEAWKCGDDGTEDPAMEYTAPPVVARLADSVFHHGVADLMNSDATDDSCEVIHLMTMGPRATPFIFFSSNQNVCDKGCWCAGVIHVGVHACVGGEWERLITYEYAVGNASGEEPSRYVGASQEICDRVASALGIAPTEVGYAVRVAYVSANLGGAGEKDWMAMERLANDPSNEYFHEHDDWANEEFAYQARALRFGGLAVSTFPFDVSLPAPHFGSGGVGTRSRLVESPRGLLRDVQKEVAERLPVQSLAATCKTLRGWQQRVDDARWAKARTRARELCARPCPDDDLWIRESHIKPHEYYGPNLDASHPAGMGGCVIA